MSPILAVDLFPRTRQKSDINLGLSNQQESQSLSQNVRLGIQFRYQAGKVIVNHNRFLGYTKDEDGKLIIDENNIPVTDVMKIAKNRAKSTK